MCSRNPNGFQVSSFDALTAVVVSGTNINGAFTASTIGVLGITNRGNVNGLMSYVDNGQFTFQHFGALTADLIRGAIRNRMIDVWATDSEKPEANSGSTPIVVSRVTCP
jgi:hypothetical protein